MKIDNKQYKWLKLLYRCSELRMIRLNKHELRILDDCINHEEYNTYSQSVLNDLRGRYKISDLNQMLVYHKSRWGKFTASAPTGFSGSIPWRADSGIHPPYNQYYIRNPKLSGKVIVTSTPNSNGHSADWYMKQWEHFGQFPIEMKDLRPNSKQDE
jgi:hypothetical protein